MILHRKSVFCWILQFPARLVLVESSRTGGYIDGMSVNLADLRGRIFSTAHVETTMSLVLRSSNGADKGRRNNRSLHLEFVY
jgi:hypothetical protein